MNGRRGPVGRRALCGAAGTLLVALALPAAVAAQAPCDPAAVAARSWTGPLARQIRLDTRDLTLRDALERVAEAAHVRLSHSLDSRPLDRPACASPVSGPLGDVLVALLRGLAVDPVAAATDHVVLAPAQARPAAPEARQAEPVVPLQPILVHADPSRPGSGRQDVVVDVLHGQRLAESPHGELWPAFNSAVPGLWLWASAGVGAGYASIRGASSFESTAPKVYIDGIQVANPLLLTRLSPEAIERIEVIRGPQGAALYGADAISGVLDITTRGAARNAGPQFGVRSSFGLSATAFSPGTAIAHDHAFSVGFGSATKSASLDASLGTSGEPLAGSWSRHFDAGGAVRVVGERSLISGTFRLETQRAATAISPVLAGSLDESGGLQPSLATVTDADALSLRHFTAGVRASLMPEGAWTHSFVMGVDGYSLDGGEGAAVDAFEASYGTRAVGSSALRGTLRSTSSATFRPTPWTSAAFTASFEHTLLRQAGIGASAPPYPAADSMAGDLGVRLVDASRNDTGAGAQLDLAFFDRWFVTGGVRFEYTDALAGIGGIVPLPTLGAAWTALDGPIDLKLRSSWGKGIRWPELTTGGGGWETTPVVYVPLDLGPEQQTGIEAGVDVDVGDALSLRLTHFDQTASGLVQRVVLPAGPSGAGIRPGGRPAWAYQNVGEITNRGWEVQGSSAHGPLTVVASFAIVDSRVRRLASGYAGDLRPGDRMLGVPERTYGLNATWSAASWSATVGASRATDWLNYDRVALAEALLEDAADPDLRNYWRRYAGVTHLNAYLARALDAGFTLVLSGDNLLNRLTGEPDNATVLRGRTVSLGVRATF